MFYHEFGIVVACDHVLMEPICRGEILECKYFMPFNFGLYQRWQINGTHVYIVVVQGEFRTFPNFQTLKGTIMLGTHIFYYYGLYFMTFLKVS